MRIWLLQTEEKESHKPTGLLSCGFTNINTALMEVAMRDQNCGSYNHIAVAVDSDTDGNTFYVIRRYEKDTMQYLSVLPNAFSKLDEAKAYAMGMDDGYTAGVHYVSQVVVRED